MAGPNPTTVQAFGQMAEFLDVVDERRKHGNSNTPNVVTMYDELLAKPIDGVYTGALAGLLSADVGAAGALCSPAVLRQAWEAVVRESLRAEALPHNRDEVPSLGAGLRAFIREMVDDAALFKSRNMTFATPTFTTASTGTGAIRRCTVDRYGNNLEGTGAEAKRARCVADQTMPGGKKHLEVFEVKGAARSSFPGLDWSGSGALGRLTAVDADSAGILQNAHFRSGPVSDNTAFAATTSLASWVLSSTTAFHPRTDSGAVYVPQVPIGGVTGWSLEAQTGTSGTITQTIQTQSPGRGFDPDRPYVFEVFWKRLSSATGTLKLKLGSVEATVDVSTGTNGVWNKLQFATNNNRWYRQFGNAGDVAAIITTDTIAVGTVVIASPTLAPMQMVDGTFYLALGGATPFLFDDEATWTDTQGATTIMSYWLWQACLTPSGAPDLALLAEMGNSWIPTTTTATSITIAD